MTVIGYTMMCEQAGPKELVRDVQAAEAAGFEFAVISDHYFPWVDAMGHSPYAWSVLGAAAQVTSGWFGGGWKVNSELPGPAAFEAASRFVRPEDIADVIHCGDSVDAVVGAVKEFADAGFTHVALGQIGGDHQAGFVDWWQRDLRAALGAGEGGK